MAQFYLRVAIALGFLAAVADRFGWLGAPGTPGIAWGNWNLFIGYTRTLLPFLPNLPVQVCAVLATAAEAVLALMLLAGVYVRMAAIGSGILTLLFALAMTFSVGYKAPLNFSVYVVSAAAFVLATCPSYRFSVLPAAKPGSIKKEGRH